MLHPFMGIEQWDRVGMSVRESAQALHRIGYLDRRLMRIEAGHMIARPEYEVKGALGRFVWQDAECCDQLRDRCRQLRMSPAAFDKCPDPALERLTDKALASGSTLELLAALFEVVKPAQIAAIQAYLDRAQPIVDEPTIRLLRHQLLDREAQVAWGRAAIAALAAEASEEERERARQWRVYLQADLRAAGGADSTDGAGDADGSAAAEAADRAAAEARFRPFELPRRSVRDRRFRTSAVKMAGMTFEDSDQGRFLQMMLHRYFEMSPAEAVAHVHFTTEGKPWAFYRDTARHLWDEVRHCWFGEAALRAKGYDVHSFENWTGFYDMAGELFERDETYTHLTVAIEKAAMKYPPGKREEWEFCRDRVREPLMTTFQDFDWADEVVHAGFGQRWIVEELYGGDQQLAMEAAEATVAKRARFMERRAQEAAPPAPGNGFAGGY